jgi:hypothetical protein
LARNVVVRARPAGKRGDGGRDDEQCDSQLQARFPPDWVPRSSARCANDPGLEKRDTRPSSGELRAFAIS